MNLKAAPNWGKSLEISCMAVRNLGSGGSGYFSSSEEVEVVVVVVGGLGRRCSREVIMVKMLKD